MCGQKNRLKPSINILAKRVQMNFMIIFQKGAEEPEEDATSAKRSKRSAMRRNLGVQDV